MFVRIVLVSALRLVFQCVNLMPYNVQKKIGSSIGWLCYWGIPKRRAVAKNNLSICFPDKTPEERGKLLRGHFYSLGQNIIDMHAVWFGHDAPIKNKMRLLNEHYLTEAIANGKGVVLLSGHFTSLELPFCSLQSICRNIGAMYREQKNDTWNKIMYEGRSRNIDRLIPHTDIKNLISALNENLVIWYAPDQHYAKKRSTPLSFFGQSTTFNSSIENIHKITNCIVLTQFSSKLPDGTYEVAFGSPILPNEKTTITEQYVRRLESYIRQVPEQYYWVHKRFK